MPMSRTVSRRGRMRSTDELRMQMNTKFIEDEVDGQDLVPSLYTSQILDTNDKDEILSGRTRLDRTRRLIDTLLLRGPGAFDEFLQSLDSSGYDHVAFRLRNSVPEQARRSVTDLDAAHTCRSPITSSNNVFLTATSFSNSANNYNVDSSTPQQISALGIKARNNDNSHAGKVVAAAAAATNENQQDEDEQSLARDFTSDLSMSVGNGKNKTIDERLKRIEDSCFILSRRVTRVEDRVNTSADLPEDELYILKEELSEIKNDTLQQIYDLTLENEQKTAVIQSLSQEIEDRKTKLAQAQEKIESLEKRIVDLETQKGRAEADVKLLKERLEDNEKQIEEQHNHFLSESLRMRNQLLTQNKKLKEQGDALVELQKQEMENAHRLAVQENDMHEHRLQMAEHQQQLGLLAQVLHGMTQTGMAPGGALPANANNANNPVFCISGNQVSVPTERGSTVRSVKRSAAPPLFRGSKRK